jgi:hypothetical protein
LTASSSLDPKEEEGEEESVARADMGLYLFGPLMLRILLQVLVVLRLLLLLLLNGVEQMGRPRREERVREDLRGRGGVRFVSVSAIFFFLQDGWLSVSFLLWINTLADVCFAWIAFLLWVLSLHVFVFIVCFLGSKPKTENELPSSNSINSLKVQF